MKAFSFCMFLLFIISSINTSVVFGQTKVLTEDQLQLNKKISTSTYLQSVAKAAYTHTQTANNLNFHKLKINTIDTIIKL